MPTRQPAAEIGATTVVPAPPEAVFGFLSDLANHWRLVDRYVEVLSLSGRNGASPDSALVRLRGPMGVRRTVRTRVTESRAPGLIVGTAELGARTRARVTWTLYGGPAETRVRLTAEVERAGAPDRMLLALGGRTWLERRFEHGLERLAERFPRPVSPSASPPGRPRAGAR